MPDLHVSDVTVT